MTGKAPLLVVAAFLLAGSTSSAHHSFAATYDAGKEVKIEGILVQFQFRNPHSFVHVEALDESGQPQRWAIEWGAIGSLAAEGVTRNTLKYGDKVIITGAPSRTPGDRKLRMNTLRRTSDGFGWGAKPGQVVE